MDELPHHGADDTHLALAALLQARGPSLKERTAPQRSHRREVESFAQPSVTDL